MKMQTRSYSSATVMMADATTEGRNVVGTVIPYGSLSRNLGGFVERFMPGSVSRSVASGLVCALLNHNPSQPVADQKAGTLRLLDSQDALRCQIQMSDASYAKDAAIVMKERGGTGTGMSFGFSETDLDARWLKEGGQNVCEVRAATLGEVSILTGMPPAYAATNCSIRSLINDAAGQGEVDLADRYGIDLDVLASAFTAIKRGLILTTAEEQILQTARSLFASAKRPNLDAANERVRSLLLV